MFLALLPLMVVAATTAKIQTERPTTKLVLGKRRHLFHRFHKIAVVLLHLARRWRAKWNV